MGALCASILFALITWLPSQPTGTSKRSIEDIRPGHRVLVDAPEDAILADVAREGGTSVAWSGSDGSGSIRGLDDPLRADTDAAHSSVRRADYRLVHILAERISPHGPVEDIHVQTLQPLAWIEEHNVQRGGQAPIPMDMVELGLPEGLTGLVTAVLPCPKLASGPGRLVLTTVNSLSGDTVEVTVITPDGELETIQSTANHSFYSVSRGEWLCAQDLLDGEHLHGLDGIVTVADVRQLPGVHRVYNLTVQGLHFYHVANAGVLVHNNYDRTSPPHAVIGENMERVNEFASRTGGETIDSWMKKKNLEWSPEVNDRFIKEMTESGAEIHDVGPDFGRRLSNRIAPSEGRPPSRIYGGEREQLRGYENYVKEYERTGKYEGGVPGFDN